LNYRYRAPARGKPLLEVQLCVECCRALWPALTLPTYVEAVLLTQVCIELDRCSLCRPQANRIRQFVQACPPSQRDQPFWSWVHNP
jgi:hypothetical protein